MSKMKKSKMFNKPCKREIGKRPSEIQKLQLIEFLEQHKETALDRTKPAEVTHQIWEELSWRLNKLDGAVKNGYRWRKFWMDLRGYTREKYYFNKVRAKNITNIERRILAIVPEPIQNYEIEEISTKVENNDTEIMDLQQQNSNDSQLQTRQNRQHNKQIYQQNIQQNVKIEKRKIHSEPKLLLNSNKKRKKHNLHKIFKEYLKIDKEYLKIDKRKLKLEKEQLKINMEKLDIERGKLEIERGRLEIEREQLEFERKKLSTEREQLQLKKKDIKKEDSYIIP